MKLLFDIIYLRVALKFHSFLGERVNFPSTFPQKSLWKLPKKPFKLTVDHLILRQIQQQDG